MFTVLSATSKILSDQFLVQITSKMTPKPSGPNKFFEMINSFTLDSNKSFPKEAAHVSSSPLSEIISTLSHLVSSKASQISLAPLELKKLEFKFKISSFYARTIPCDKGNAPSNVIWL